MKEWQIAKQELAIESQQASTEYRTTGRLASEESIRDWNPKKGCTQLYAPQISSNPSTTPTHPPKCGPHNTKYTSNTPIYLNVSNTHSHYQIHTTGIEHKLPIIKYKTQVTVDGFQTW